MLLKPEDLAGPKNPTPPEIGLGTRSMGTSPIAPEQTDDRESIAAIHQALDCGIRIIDTAPSYGDGHVEELVGKAVRGRRGEVFLVSGSGFSSTISSGTTAEGYLAPENIVHACENSLRRLKTETIDLYYCHSVDPGTPIRHTMQALCTLLDQQKIGAIGLSNYSPEQILEAREFGPIEWVQTPFSPIQMRAAQDTIPFCVEHGIGVFTTNTLARGLLSGKYSDSAQVPAHAAKHPDFIGERFRRNLEIVKQLQCVAQEYGRSITQLVINWTATFPGISAPIIGANRPSQVRENMDALGWKLEDRHRLQIEAIVRS